MPPMLGMPQVSNPSQPGTLGQVDRRRRNGRDNTEEQIDAYEPDN